MVVHAFPVAKLGALLIKQISKPIANAVKTKAKSSPAFRRYVCLPPATFYNWCEVKLKMWLLHLGQPVNITVLNEAASIDLGANLVGESVIFLIAAGILVAEYNRSSRKEAAKEAARLAEVQQIQDSLRDLFIQTEEQAAHIRELTRKVVEFDTGRSQLTGTYQSSTKSEPPRPPIASNQNSYPKPESNTTDTIENVDLMKCDDCLPVKGVVFKAVNSVQRDFFWGQNRPREPGIITVALNQLYKDVYKKSINF